MTTTNVQYSIPINMLHDDADRIAQKMQFAKRQAFALLNTELADDATYIIHTSGAYSFNQPDLDHTGNPVVTGDGVYTYRIRAVAWVEPPAVDWSNSR